MGSVRFNRQRQTWAIDYVDARGVRTRQSIGKGEAGRKLARQILAQREAEAVMGKHRILPARTPRFAEFADDWLTQARARVRPKTADFYRVLLDHHLRPFFGEMRLGAITRADVEKYLLQASTTPRDGRKHPAAPKTVNHSLTLLKQLLGDAIERGLLQEQPAARVAPLAVAEREEPRFLTPEQVDRLLAASPEPWRTLWLFLLHTGCRRGEALAVRWSDVDLEGRTVAIRHSPGRVRDGSHYVIREGPLKTRASRRTLTLSETLAAALLAHPAGDDPVRDYVFPSGTGGPLDPDGVDRAWRRCLDLAGLPSFPLHSTRHTTIAALIAGGAHPKAIQAWAGHAHITTTLQTYGGLMPSALEGLETRLEAALNGDNKATAGVARENAGPRKSLKPAS